MQIFHDIGALVDAMITLKERTLTDEDGGKVYKRHYVVFNYLIARDHPIPILESEQASLDIAKESLSSIKFALKISLTLLTVKELKLAKDDLNRQDKDSTRSG